MGDIPVEQRSPSPEPIFDKNGQRVNSRLVLRRQKLERERAALVESLKPKVALRSEPDTRARAHGAWRRSTPPFPFIYFLSLVNNKPSMDLFGPVL